MVNWINTAYGAFCPSCEEHIPAGSEDYDWGCSTCGYPDQRAVQDYHAGYDNWFPEDEEPAPARAMKEG